MRKDFALYIFNEQTKLFSGFVRLSIAEGDFAPFEGRPKGGGSDLQLRQPQPRAEDRVDVRRQRPDLRGNSFVSRSGNSGHARHEGLRRHRLGHQVSQHILEFD